jgi:hypothetical protein
LKNCYNKKEKNCLSTAEDGFLSIAEESGSGSDGEVFLVTPVRFGNRKAVAVFLSHAQSACHASPHSAPEEAEARVRWLP